MIHWWIRQLSSRSATQYHFRLQHHRCSLHHGQRYATNNHVMLKLFEEKAGVVDFTVEQPQIFRVQDGDIRCMAHIINLAVQSPLRTLNATPAEDFNVYFSKDNCARILSNKAKYQVTSSLEKLRRHNYVHRDRRLWRDALQKHTTTDSRSTIFRLERDMPVRWDLCPQCLSVPQHPKVPSTLLIRHRSWP